MSSKNSPSWGFQSNKTFTPTCVSELTTLSWPTHPLTVGQRSIFGEVHFFTFCGILRLAESYLISYSYSKRKKDLVYLFLDPKKIYILEFTFKSSNTDTETRCHSYREKERPVEIYRITLEYTIDHTIGDEVISHIQTIIIVTTTTIILL